MPEPGLSLLVVYTDRLSECLEFYRGLGLQFVAEQHGAGPAHFSTTLPGGTVVELYPAGSNPSTGRLRLGFAVSAPPSGSSLTAGTHLLRDPDGRVVEVRVG